ncbi:MAG: hypothetical protein JWM68_2628 [Verrucomicrobiales bacterium]|nr:hypothetical protein [Verrucomicrobiales bacterium]
MAVVPEFLVTDFMGTMRCTSLSHRQKSGYNGVVPILTR